MATSRDIKRRIRSAKNIGQITKALELVSAVKMRRAQLQALAGRPYTDGLVAAIRTLNRKTEVPQHPYLRRITSVNQILVIIVSPHKGLAGSLITNLSRTAITWVDACRHGRLVLDGTTLDLSAGVKFSSVTWGKKSSGISLKAGITPQAAFYQDPRQNVDDQVRALIRFVTAAFRSKTADLVVVAYSQFINTVIQRPVITQFLPIASLAFASDTAGPLYLFEPGPAEVLDQLLEHYVQRLATQIVLDGFAAEHSARMIAMKNAHDNAQDIVKDFTLTLNKTRQAGITNEIADIVSGSAVSA